MNDSFKHKGLRKKLVEELQSKGISNEAVLEAISNIPRHAFLDNAFLEFAYQDKAFPIGAGQTISQPYTVAFQTELLGVEKGHKVLEIGTGSGYQTSVLCELGAKVFSVERQKELYDKTRVLLKKMNYRAKLFYGDGYKGLPAFKPFDKVLVTCGAPYVPEDLLQQLKPGGDMVIPVGDGDVQIMTRIKRVDENNFERKEYGEFRFVPMLYNKERN